MAGVCGKCKAQRRELYWNVTPGNKQHFFKIMLGDFRNFLRIPRKFMSEFKGTLSRKVVLQGSSGNRWTTTLVQIEDDTVLRNGWQNFAKDHSLEEYNFLVFKYVEDSLFEVLIFDDTGCEREDSYFVEPGAESCCSWRNHMEVDESTTSDEKEINVRQQTRRRKKKSVVLDDKRQHDSQKRKRQHDSQKKKGKEVMYEVKEEEEEQESDSASNQQIRQKKSGSETKEWKEESKQRCTTYYESRRRRVTKEEMDRAFKLASRHSTKKPSCMIRMKRTHVLHLFILTIPKYFADSCLPKQSEEIMLRVGSKTWYVGLNRRNDQCTLKKGWSQFVLDNNIETEDVCVLELEKARTNKQPTTLNVHIYRVVEKIAPLKVVKPSQQKENM